MNLSHIQTITKNPFFGSEIFIHFANGYNKDTIPITLSYFILPLILNKRTRNIFSEVNKNNTLYSLLKKHKSILSNIEERVEKHRKLTNMSLIVAHNQNDIELSSAIKLNRNVYYSHTDVEVREFYRAAYYLGYFFGKEKRVQDIFKLFTIIE